MSGCCVPLRVCFGGVEQILDPGLLSLGGCFLSLGPLARLADQAHQTGNPEMRQTRSGGLWVRVYECVCLVTLYTSWRRDFAKASAAAAAAGQVRFKPPKSSPLLVFIVTALILRLFCAGRIHLLLRLRRVAGRKGGRHGDGQCGGQRLQLEERNETPAGSRHHNQYTYYKIII